MNEQNIGSRQILDSLKEINQITEIVKSGSDEIGEGSSMVLGEARKLKTSTEASTRRIKEINDGAAEISASAENVMNMSISNKEMVDDIRRELDFFRTD